MADNRAAVLNDAIDSLIEMLRVDGADLRIIAIDEHAPSVELSVDFADVDCEDCVLPPDRLHDTVTSVISKRAGRPVSVLLHDPRRAQPHAAAGGGAGGGAQWIDVLDPAGVAPDVGEPNPGPAAGPLAGKTVAIRHDILWDSFDWTVDEWTAGFKAAGADVLTWKRVQGLVGADYERAQAEYEAMLAKADLAVSGLGNCGSCTSWSVRDAITASTHGLPAAAVATEQFEPLARVLAADGGRPGLRVMVLPYPYDTLPEEQVRAHARALFPQLLAVLGATV
ncbi:MAG: hypothetical protein Q7V88_14890 [Actinomycetota bacterium]|nr:hypothetical protein [Actinomycetota bacterium]